MASKKSLLVLSAFLVFCAGCYENCNPVEPSGLGRGSSEVWVSPNVASQDFTKLASQPEQWVQARSKITTIGFFIQNLWPQGSCPICGLNTFQNFMDAVPGGMFNWLNANGIKIAIEAGAIKPGDCSAEANSSSIIQVISNVQAHGGTVSFVALDEPFASGLSMNQNSATQQTYCGFSVGKTAEIVKGYMNRVNSMYPGVQIGLIEPYPYFSIKQIESFIDALEIQGVHIPFFHLDFDPGYRDIDYVGDIREIKEFCRQKNIPFGVIIIGGDGTSNETAANGAMLEAIRIQEAIGIHSQDHILLQSWLDFPPTRGSNDQRLYPDNLPESSPVTMMGLVNTILNMQ